MGSLRLPGTPPIWELRIAARRDPITVSSSVARRRELEASDVKSRRLWRPGIANQNPPLHDARKAVRRSDVDVDDSEGPPLDARTNYRSSRGRSDRRFLSLFTGHPRSAGFATGLRGPEPSVAGSAGVGAASDAGRATSGPDFR